MGDAFHKVRSGEALRIPAQAYNAFIDSARFVRALEQDLEFSKVGLNLRRIRMKNTTREDRARFHVLAIDDPLFTPGVNLDGFRNQTAFIGVIPDKTLHQGRFAIMLEPAVHNSIVIAQVTGVCPVKVSVVDEDHAFADIKDGSCDTLESRHDGSARILWKEPGTGTKWAVVALGMPASMVVPGKITGVTGDGIGGVVTYDAESYRGPKFTVEGATPVNRPFGDTDIEPSGAGDECLLYCAEDGTVRLIQLTEQVIFDACADEPPPVGAFVAERKDDTATGSGEQLLFRATLPEDQLGLIRGVRFTAVLRRTVGDDGATFIAKYGGTAFATIGPIKASPLKLMGMLWADGDTDAQRGNLQASSGEYEQGTAAEDSTQPQDLDIVLVLETPTDEYTADWFSVELIG